MPPLDVRLISLFVGLPLISAVACGQDPAPETEVETPPPLVETIEADVETIDDPAVMDVSAAEAPDIEVDEQPVKTEDHEHDEHNQGEHDHHDHAGGEAHVHGLAELAVVRDGTMISISLEAPLANFGLSETQPRLGDISAYTDNLVTLDGGDCERTDSDVGTRTSGNHGSMSIDLAYECTDIDSLTTLTVNMFEAFPGFEEIDAVVLLETGQTALTLTPSSNEIPLD